MRVDWLHGDRTGLISTYDSQTWILAEHAERSHLFAHLDLVQGATLQSSPELYVYENMNLRGVLDGVTHVSYNVVYEYIHCPVSIKCTSAYCVALRTLFTV